MVWWLAGALAAPSTYLVPHGPASASAVVVFDSGVLVVGEGATWFCDGRGCAWRPPLPYPRKDVAVAVDPQGQVWAMGGWSGVGGEVEESDRIHRYDSEAGQWVAMGRMPRSYDRAVAMFEADGSLIVGGLRDWSAASLSVRSARGKWSVISESNPPRTPVFARHPTHGVVLAGFSRWGAMGDDALRWSERTYQGRYGEYRHAAPWPDGSVVVGGGRHISQRSDGDEWPDVQLESRDRVAREVHRMLPAWLQGMVATDDGVLLAGQYDDRTVARCVDSRGIERAAVGAPAEGGFAVHTNGGLLAFSRPREDGRVELVVGMGQDFCMQ